MLWFLDKKPLKTTKVYTRMQYFISNSSGTLLRGNWNFCRRSIETLYLRRDILYSGKSFGWQAVWPAMGQCPLCKSSGGIRRRNSDNIDDSVAKVRRDCNVLHCFQFLWWRFYQLVVHCFGDPCSWGSESLSYCLAVFARLAVSCRRSALGR